MEYNAGEAIGLAGMRVIYKKPGVPEKELKWIPQIKDERYTDPTILSIFIHETIERMNKT